MSTLTQILRTARAGNPARALRLFMQAGLQEVTGDPKVLTLKGRLLKDQAKRSSGQKRRELFLEASHTYASAFEIDGSSYALINAAALVRLSGEVETSRELAAQTLAMIESDPQEGETPYWREATRSEALLLLDRREEAEAALALAISKQPLAYEDHAATLGQFETIVDQRGGDPIDGERQGQSADWLEPYRPPRSVFFSGLIHVDENEAGLKQRIDEAIAAMRPGFAFGALAAGSDIILAEALVDSGAQLHLHLPLEAEEFRRISVEPYGKDWGERFDRLIEVAASIETLEPALPTMPATDLEAGRQNGRSFSQAVDLASLSAMGASLRHASVLKSRSGAITLEARREAPRDSVHLWEKAGHSLTRIEVQRQGGEPRAVSRQAHKQGPLQAVVTMVAPAPENDDIAGALGLQWVEQGGRSFYLGTPSACYALLDKNARHLANTKACLLIDTLSASGTKPIAGPTDGKGASLPTPLLERAVQLNDAADIGICLSDRLTARITQVLSPGLSVEEIGELRTLQGPLSLWSIAA